MLQLKLAEKRGELVLVSAVEELIETLAGVTLTKLSSLPTRCAPRGDLATRRAIEQCVLEIRREIATVCNQLADERGEPPLGRTGLSMGTTPLHPSGGQRKVPSLRVRDKLSTRNFR